MGGILVIFQQACAKHHCVLGMGEIFGFRWERECQVEEETGLEVHLVSVPSSPSPDLQRQSPGSAPPLPGPHSASQQHRKAREKHLPVAEHLLCAHSP